VLAGRRALAATAASILLALACAAAAASHPRSFSSPGREASRLARELPLETARLGRLRDPAGTIESQVSVALGELERMSPLTYDPHYLPALVATGRVFMAATGQDPLTRTQIQPEYLGLDRELAESAAHIDKSAGQAARLAGTVRRLTSALKRTRRRADRLQRSLERLRGRDARSAR
jgi:hypothetical protein